MDIYRTFADDEEEKRFLPYRTMTERTYLALHKGRKQVQNCHVMNAHVPFTQKESRIVSDYLHALSFIIPKDIYNAPPLNLFPLLKLLPGRPLEAIENYISDLFAMKSLVPQDTENVVLFSNALPRFFPAINRPTVQTVEGIKGSFENVISIADSNSYFILLSPGKSPVFVPLRMSHKLKSFEVRSDRLSFSEQYGSFSFKNHFCCFTQGSLLYSLDLAKRFICTNLETTVQTEVVQPQDIIELHFVPSQVAVNGAGTCVALYSCPGLYIFSLVDQSCTLLLEDEETEPGMLPDIVTELLFSEVGLLVCKQTRVIIFEHLDGAWQIKAETPNCGTILPCNGNAFAFRDTSSIVFFGYDMMITNYRLADIDTLTCLAYNNGCFAAQIGTDIYIGGLAGSPRPALINASLMFTDILPIGGKPEMPLFLGYTSLPNQRAYVISGSGVVGPSSPLHPYYSYVIADPLGRFFATLHDNGEVELITLTPYD